MTRPRDESEPKHQSRQREAPLLTGLQKLLTRLRASERRPSDGRLDEMMLCEELFHAPIGVAFADFITDGHRETWPIRSNRFRNWVRRCYYQAMGAAAGAAVIGSALDLLEARAQFDAAERAVNIRVAEHAGRSVG